MADAFPSTPPGPGAGDTSRRTRALRPDIGLSAEVVRDIRRLRKQGHTPAEIAGTLALPVGVVDRALLAMRTPLPERSRGTLNITTSAHELVMAERQGDEPVWATFDRLLSELMGYRIRIRRLERRGALRQPADTRRG